MRDWEEFYRVISYFKYSHRSSVNTISQLLLKKLLLNNLQIITKSTYLILI